ncbi:MAG: putative sulfate/molybdate transporter [Candidatus Thiodiazotropha sp.]
MQLRLFATETSGAFADLGTFLPIVIGVLALGRMDPTGLLVGFGVFALAVALIYRRPVPVQPMKVVAAIVIASPFSPGAVAATGVLLGVVVLLLGLSGWIDRLARRLPENLLQGIQVGVGLILAWSGLKLMHEHWMIGVALVAGLLLIERTLLKGYAVLILIAGSIGVTLMMEGETPKLNFGWFLPQMVSLQFDDFWQASLSVFLPQLVLTLTNAVLVTAIIAAELFPDDRARITPRRLALSSGGLNILLAPFGAFPMCHGAGGLVVQHRFGARTGLAPAIFGVSCLSLGLFLGPDAFKLLSLLPVSTVGALLVLAGIHMSLTRRVLRARDASLAVIIMTAIAALFFNVALGLLVGLGLEWVRRYFARRTGNGDSD